MQMQVLVVDVVVVAAGAANLRFLLKFWSVLGSFLGMREIKRWTVG